MDKRQRKAMIKQYRDGRKNGFIDSLPMSCDNFHKLFDYLDERLSEADCNHDLALTEEFLKRHDIAIKQVEDWLLDNGGGCDCEVLANVEDLFDQYNI